MRADAPNLPPALRHDASSDVPYLALSAADAAKALSISEKHLRGIPDLRQVRIGARVVYPLHLLKAWLDEHAEPHSGHVTGNAGN
jgi:hypothetical protein